MELPSFPLPPPPLAPPPSHTHHAINIRPPGDVCGYRDCPVGRDCFSASALTPFGIWPIAFRYSRNVISLFSVPTPTLPFHTHPHWCLKNDLGVHPSHIFSLLLQRQTTLSWLLHSGRTSSRRPSRRRRPAT